MASHRIDRTTEDIRRELLAVFRELKDPRTDAMLSIVKLELANDLSHCKVYVSSMEGMDTTRRAVEGLKSAAGLIRSKVGSRVRMRRTPEFHFIADDSIAESARIQRIMEELP